MIPADSRSSLEAVLDATMPSLMERWRVPGVSLAFIRRREICSLRQYGILRAGSAAPVKPGSIFEACSMTKPLFAYAVLKLAEEGALNLHRPLVDYLGRPYLENEERHRRITAWMVLTHSSGLPNWREGGRLSALPPEVQFEPGSSTLYSGEGFWFLQRTVEQLTGQGLAEWLAERLLQPLGMESSSLVWLPEYEGRAASGHAETGEPHASRSLFHEANAAFSLYTTAEDYARFLLEMMNPDRSAPYSLSAAALRQMLARHRPLEGVAPIQRSGPSQSGAAYTGLGWRMDELAGGDRVYHGGSNQTGFRCYSELDPREGSGLVIMTNADRGDSLWRELVAAI